MPRWRLSIGSRTAWPTRCAPIAQQPSPLPLEQLALRAAVGVVRERAVDLEVVAPAGELEPVEAPFAGLRGKLFEGEIGPLAGEQRDGTAHRFLQTRDGRRNRR